MQSLSLSLWKIVRRLGKGEQASQVTNKSLEKVRKRRQCCQWQTKAMSLTTKIRLLDWDYDEKKVGKVAATVRRVRRKSQKQKIRSLATPRVQMGPDNDDIKQKHKMKKQKTEKQKTGNRNEKKKFIGNTKSTNGTRQRWHKAKRRRSISLKTRFCSVLNILPKEICPDSLLGSVCCQR